MLKIIKNNTFRDYSNKKSRDYKRLLFLSKPFMMNMRNQGSKENLGVKFKEGIWVFCNINNSEWF